MLLKELTELNGVSGNEGAVRKFILEKIKPYADEITVDSMGSIIALKKGTEKGGKRIGFCAHMDEVGLMVTSINDEGFVKFYPVGGVDEKAILAKRVLVGENKVRGITGIKAIHRQDKTERNTVVAVKNMYIDIGAKSKEEAEKLVGIGDYVAFDSEYMEFGEGKVKAKALDDRAGCAILIECMKKQYKNDIYFCFSTQEETGLRGATIIAHRLCLDTAFIVETTSAADVPFMKENQRATELKKGPVISIKDNKIMQDRGLVEYVISLAEEKNIPWQHKRFGSGENETRVFMDRGGACKALAISVPCRYIHSPSCVIDMTDFDNTKALVEAIAENCWKLGGNE